MMLNRNFTRPSFAMYSGTSGTYEEVKESGVPSLCHRLVEEWNIPRSDDGGIIELLGVKLRPATKSKVKVFFGSKSRKAVAWTEDYPTSLMGLHHECYGVKFLEQEDELTDEELAPYRKDCREHGQLRISWKGVVFSIEDGNAKVELNDPEKYLSWCSSGRFQVGDLNAIYKEIASQVDCTVPRRAFVQCDWQIVSNDGKTALTPRKSAWLTINKDLSVVEHSNRQVLVDVAVAALRPIAQSRYDQAVKAYHSGDLKFTRSYNGPDPWREDRQDGWVVRVYFNRGLEEKTNIRASALSPW